MSKITRQQRELDYLKSSQMKDKIDLEHEKSKFLKEIKNVKKEDLFPVVKKLTLWQRIKKVLNF
jgi:hypothetical protein